MPDERTNWPRLYAGAVLLGAGFGLLLSLGVLPSLTSFIIEPTGGFMYADAMLAELEQEAPTTRRVLERVPDEHLGWRPGPQAMTLGQLAWHVATIPGGICGLARMESLDAAGVNFEPDQPSRADTILPAYEASLEQARGFLRGFTDQAATTPWRLTENGREIFTIPKAALIRTLMFNHWYHHRGQLAVYYRCLGVPVPAIYGRSADEKLFGA